jgi:hypothetical protein
VSEGILRLFRKGGGRHVNTPPLAHTRTCLASRLISIHVWSCHLSCHFVGFRPPLAPGAPAPPPPRCASRSHLGRPCTPLRLRTSEKTVFCQVSECEAAVARFKTASLGPAGWGQRTGLRILGSTRTTAMAGPHGNAAGFCTAHRGLSGDTSAIRHLEQLPAIADGVWKINPE